MLSFLALWDQLGHGSVPRGHHSFPQALPIYGQRLGTAQFRDAHGSRHKDRQQSRVERRTSSEQGSSSMNAGLKAQSSNLLISQSWHKQQQLKTVPLVCPLAACRSSPAECQAIMCG